MKSVVLHIGRDDGQEARFQAAVDIVRSFEGHLTCLQVVPVETFASIDPYGVSYLLAQTVDQIRAQEKDEREGFEARLKVEGVSWDWHNHAGSPTRLLADHSWLADLVVVSAPGHAWKPRMESPPTAAAVVVRSRAPVLVVPDNCRGFDCSGPVVIAWNGSPESCGAIRAALPLLKQASSVVLVTVAEESEYDLPPTEAAEFLSRHGVSSELMEVSQHARPISDTLLQTATERGASCLVMGAYGHSRLRENILGGVTKGMLEKTKLPLLLAH